jgi:hypothetical protein
MKPEEIIKEEGEGAGMPVTNTSNAGDPLGDQIKLPIKLFKRYEKFKAVRKKRKSDEVS